MPTPTTTGTGAAALMKYFGKLPGQKISDFAAEVRALTDEDRQQLVAGIEDGTLDY